MNLDSDRDAAPRTHDEAHPHHVDVGRAPDVVPASNARMRAIFVGLVVVLIVLYVVTTLPRRTIAKELAAEASTSDAPPVVQLATVTRATVGGTLDLPGTIEALHEGAIYARVGGYVKSWRYDIGASVHAGDVLAELDAPELAQGVEQARHQLGQVKATLGLAQADLARWKEMAKDSAVSSQELDQKQAAFDVATADVGASQANLQRLIDQEGYTHVRAPFTGVITARNVDIGALITPSGATSSPVSGSTPTTGAGAAALFRIAQTDTVRTYVTVPEAYATAMNAGLAADVNVQEISGKTFTGHVARTSRSLDADSRTLLTEVDIANPGSRLLPGMYADVRMKFPMTAPPLIIPSTALLIRTAGPQVLVVDNDAPTKTTTVHLHSIQIGRDYGATIEVLGGVDEGMRIVTSPGAEIGDRSKVVVAAPIAADTSKPAAGVKSH